MPLALGLYLAFIVAVPFGRPALFAVGGLPVQISDVLLVATWAAFAVAWVRGRVRLRADRLLFASLAFLLALLLSLALNGALEPRRLLKLAAYASMVLLPVLSQSLLDARGFELAVRAWLVAATLTVVVALASGVAYFVDPGAYVAICSAGSVGVLPVPRLCLPEPNPNLLGSVVAIALPLLIVRRRWLTLAGAALAVALTFSIALGAAAIGAAVALRRPAAYFAAALLAGGLALAAVCGRVPHGQGQLSVGDTDVRLFDGPRWSIWRGAARTLAAHPLFGAGYGTRVAETADPRAFRSAGVAARLAPGASERLEAHDIWLNVGGQAGLVGLAAFLWLAFELARRLSGTDALALALAGAFAGGFVYHGLFAALEESRHLWAFFALLAAVPVAVRDAPR